MVCSLAKSTSCKLLLYGIEKPSEEKIIDFTSGSTWLNLEAHTCLSSETRCICFFSPGVGCYANVFSYQDHYHMGIWSNHII